MLSELYVENFALIEKVQVNFQNGLNVLTGETGAGKSLIIDAVGLLTGGRAAQEMIRSGAEKALIQGTFTGPFLPDVAGRLEEAGLDTGEDCLILSREIMKSGKHTCRINYRTVPLNLYRDLARRLVNVHGQHEQVSLLEEENQISLLDSFGGEKIEGLVQKVRESFLSLQEIRRQLAKITAMAREGERKKDLLRFQIREIEDAGLKPGEEEELLAEKKVLSHAERLAKDSTAAYEKLYGTQENGARDLIVDAAFLLKPLAVIDGSLEPLAIRLTELGYLIDDLVREISDYRETIVSDPRRLEQIEKRLFEILKLKKKYGQDVPEIIVFAAAASEELAGLEHGAQTQDELERALVSKQEEYRGFASQLTDLRGQSAAKLSQAISGELHQLQMPEARFSVCLEKAASGPRGEDGVSFLISANPGEDLKPVAKIASGGEMSRIMLGMKVILAQLDQIPTLIFDEIDSGLGGRVVYAVGEKLSLVSDYTQVLCVTHSPVTASFADQHLYISKETSGGRTVTCIHQLNEGEILQELCRMLAGDHATGTTFAQARELRNAGRRQRKTS